MEIGVKLNRLEYNLCWVSRSEIWKDRRPRIEFQCDIALLLCRHSGHQILLLRTPKKTILREWASSVIVVSRGTGTFPPQSSRLPKPPWWTHCSEKKPPPGLDISAVVVTDGLNRKCRCGFWLHLTTGFSSRHQQPSGCIDPSRHLRSRAARSSLA